MKKITKHYVTSKEADGCVVLSDETLDRNMGIVKQDGWILDNFLQNPVMFYGHNTDKPPLGRWEDVKVIGNKLVGKPVFADISEYEELQIIKKLWEADILKTVSVSFLPIEVEKQEDEKGNIIYVYKKQELLEVSIVPLPANPRAMKLVYNSFRLEEVKNSVIPYKKYPLADEDYEWDASKEVKEADVEDLKIMCAWYDKDNEDNKAAYKLPHHRAKDYYTVWRGVRAAMAVLFGAMGGVDVPIDDKKGIYNHLAKHYEDFGKEPPEWKEYNILDLLEEIENLKKQNNNIEKQLADLKKSKELEDIIIIK